MDTLLSLHECDLAVAALVRESEEIPRAIEAFEAKAAGALAAVQAESDAVEEAEKLRRGHERDLQGFEVLRERYQAQTAAVKTNTEYTALLSEIENTNTKIGQLEEAILEAMEEIEQRSAQVDVVRREQQQLQTEIDQQMAERRARLKVVEEEVEIRRGERDVLVSRLERQPRAVYERVFASKGSGTAQIRGRSCGACYRDIPYETINRVQAGEVHTCGSCTRILIEIPAEFVEPSEPESSG